MWVGPEAIEHRDTLIRECSLIILFHLLPLKLVKELSLHPRWAFKSPSTKEGLCLKAVIYNVQLSRNRCHKRLDSVVTVHH